MSGTVTSADAGTGPKSRKTGTIPMIQMRMSLPPEAAVDHATRTPGDANRANVDARGIAASQPWAMNAPITRDDIHQARLGTKFRAETGGGNGASRSAIAACSSAAQRIASTTLAN